MAKFAAGVKGGNTQDWRGNDDFERRQYGSIALNWRKTAATREASAACQFRHLTAGVREAAAGNAKRFNAKAQSSQDAKKKA